MTCIMITKRQIFCCEKQVVEEEQEIAYDDRDGREEVPTMMIILMIMIMVPESEDFTDL